MNTFTPSRESCKIAAAMRIGRKDQPQTAQCVGFTHDLGEACAGNFAVYGLTGAFAVSYPDMEAVFMRFLPEAVAGDLLGIIVKLNDGARLSVEQIADVLDGTAPWPADLQEAP